MMSATPSGSPLEYASPPPTPELGDGPIVQVLPEGVVLNVGWPSPAGQFMKAIGYSLGAIGFAAATIALATSSPGVWPLIKCAGYGLISLMWGVDAASHWEHFGRLLRRDPKLAMLFLAAADQALSCDFDHAPVRKVEARLARLDFRFRRVPELYVQTGGDGDHRLFRGRPLDELEPLAAELRTLLRVDAAPAKGFPVVNVGGRDA